MLDAAAGGDDASGNDVAPVGDRRGADHQHEVAAVGAKPAHRRRHRGLVVGTADFAVQPAAQGFQALARHCRGLVQNRRLGLGQRRLHQANRAGAEGRDADQRPAVGGQR